MELDVRVGNRSHVTGEEWKGSFWVQKMFSFLLWVPVASYGAFMKYSLSIFFQCVVYINKEVYLNEKIKAVLFPTPERREKKVCSRPPTL